jgi:putative oxidoreductase
MSFMKYVAFAGRQLFSILFIVASARHFSQDTIEAAGRHGVPVAGLLVPLSGVIALMGGLSVLVGFQTRLGAWLLVIFLVPVTLLMHNFWSAADPAAFQLEEAMFMKNITMLGGALLISYFGAGPLSFDAFVQPRKDLSHEARLVSPVRDPIPDHLAVGNGRERFPR